MSSAQLDIHPDDELAPDPTAPLPPFELTHPDHTPLGLKQQVAERVAAHRARRGHSPTSFALQPGSPSNAPSGRSRPSRVRSANIAAAVAERYAHSPSYRAFLAAEAERAVHQADAAAQIATINAQAIAIAQQQLLSDLDRWDLPSDMPGGPVAIPNVRLSPLDYAALFDREPIASRFSTPEIPLHPSADAVSSVASASQFPSYTVRPYEDAEHPAATPHPPSPLNTRIDSAYAGQESDNDERLALEDEIAFRHDPFFDEVSQQEPIAANLIEFPRQLVASRKARPRLAEGPLKDDDSNAAAKSQLRIFEVEADELSSVRAAESVAPEWSSILLSALPTSDFPETGDAGYLAVNVPQAAPVSLRFMAAVVDGCIILTVQVAFTAVFALALTHLSGNHAALEIPRTTAIAATLATLAVLSLLYQLLFFTLSDATPGMRFARIGLCTFSDENPTRSAMRRRIFATILAAFPIGLGLLWAFLDEDTLGWHDRISRMYQRAY